MQGLNTIVKQNAEVAAIRQAKATGKDHYVVRGGEHGYEVTSVNPGDGKAVFVAKPDFPVEV